MAGPVGSRVVSNPVAVLSDTLHVRTVPYATNLYSRTASFSVPVSYTQRQEVRARDCAPGSAVEDPMKAALALVVIYLGMFFVAIQGGPAASVQAAPQSPSARLDSRTIDPAKEADIRSLLELVGARDQLQDSVQQTAEQYREKLLASLPRNDKEQVFVNAV